MKEQPTIDLCSDRFGCVLNCAVRYCLGRETYMPVVVQNQIRPLLPYLSDKTLFVMKRDIEEAKARMDSSCRALGDPSIDAPGWLEFLDDVKKAWGERVDKTASDKAGKRMGLRGPAC